jgi:hypothetical protein
MSATVRVLVALDVPTAQAADVEDLLASVEARLADEAGYLEDGSPVTPSAVVVTYVHDDTWLTPTALSSVYEVGIDGVDDVHYDPSCPRYEGDAGDCTCEVGQ